MCLFFVAVQIEREDEFSDRLSSRINFKGCTALHYAVLSDDIDTMKLLLKAGANPSAESDSGHVPKQYAKDPDIAKMIDEYAKQVGHLSQSLISERKIFRH